MKFLHVYAALWPWVYQREPGRARPEKEADWSLMQQPTLYRASDDLCSELRRVTWIKWIITKTSHVFCFSIRHMNNNSWSKVSPICYIWKEHGNTFHEQFCVSEKLRSQDSCLLWVFSQALRIFMDSILGLYSSCLANIPSSPAGSICPSYSTLHTSQRSPLFCILSPYGIFFIHFLPSGNS